MAHPGDPLVADPVVVVGPQFSSSNPVDLTFTELRSRRVSFKVEDSHANDVFRVKVPALSLRNRQVLQDTAGNPIVSWQKKLTSSHQRRKVFRGNSTSESDLLFSAKRSGLLQLDVFLASNTSENVCDFKVEADYFGRSCTVYQGDFSVILAEMKRQQKWNPCFAVTICPNVDQAFIASLILILHQIREELHNQLQTWFPFLESRASISSGSDDN